MTTVHLAGDAITIGSYLIQRCLLCGVPLMELNARDIATHGDSSVGGLALGGFYEVDGNRTSLLMMALRPTFDSDLDLPDHCCIRKKVPSP